MSDIWNSDLLDTTSFKWKFPCHDECCFSVSKEHATDVIEVVYKIMTKPFLETVPSESSVGIGLSYGELYELEKAFANAGVSFCRKIVQTTVASLID